jgi:glycosyltransferase involved in cell wall biosynthesis
MVSVVIPVYNRPQKVLEAVKSIQQQTIGDWEIVLVDDGSKDHTPGVLKELQEKDTRIRAIFQENGGAQSARNAGIRAARGEWVAFLDSDDQWLPKSLELRLETASRLDVAVVHSLCETIEPDGTRKQYGGPVISGNVYKELLKSQGPVFPAFLVKKSAFEKINYLDESIVAFQEWDTAIRLSRYFYFGFVNEPTFIYDCRGTDTISLQTRRGGVGYEQILKRNAFPIFCLAGPRALMRHYEIAAGWYERGQDPVSVRRCRRNAFWLKYAQPRTWKKMILNIFSKGRQE